jgi:thiol-disulfide isomerase/thioredoxin
MANLRLSQTLFIIASFFSGSFLFFSCAKNQDASSQAPQMEQLMIVEVDETDIRSTLDSLSMQQPVLINFWATWCKPCVEEFDDLVSLGQQAGDSLHVYFVSGDFSPDKAEKFLLRKGITGWSGYKTDKDEAFINAVAVEWSGALPFTQILYKGKILDQWEAKLPHEQLLSRSQAAYRKALP